jgi:hypothetical protein
METHQVENYSSPLTKGTQIEGKINHEGREVCRASKHSLGSLQLQHLHSMRRDGLANELAGEHAKIFVQDQVLHRRRQYKRWAQATK